MGNTSTTGENTSAMPGGEFDTGAPSPEARAGGATAVVVLGTGGTIAGTSAQRGDNVGYTAGQTPVLALLEGLGQRAPVPPGLRIESEQVAQIDSKDMTHALWRRLTERIAAHLARPEVAAVLVTHGTDTIEETAYLVQRVLAPEKPVVFTAAMRPADALQADGPLHVVEHAPDGVDLPGGPRHVGGLLHRRRAHRGHMVAAVLDAIAQPHGHHRAFAAQDPVPLAEVAADHRRLGPPGQFPLLVARRAPLDLPVVDAGAVCAQLHGLAEHGGSGGRIAPDVEHATRPRQAARSAQGPRPEGGFQDGVIEEGDRLVEARRRVTTDHPAALSRQGIAARKPAEATARQKTCMTDSRNASFPGTDRVPIEVTAWIGPALLFHRRHAPPSAGPFFCLP